MTHAEKVEFFILFMSKVVILAIGFMFFVKYIVEKYDLDAPGPSYAVGNSSHNFFVHSNYSIPRSSFMDSSTISSFAPHTSIFNSNNSFVDNYSSSFTSSAITSGINPSTGQIMCGSTDITGHSYGC
jgi:hypothetical protein